MDIRSIPELFGLPAAEFLTELTAGHINRTCVVVCGGEKYVLQSLNSSVFRTPCAVMDNIERVTAAFAEADCDVAVPHFIAAGDKIYAAAEGEVWRMYRYITAAADAAVSPAAAGRAFGSFIRIMDGGELCGIPAIEGFHDLDRYCGELEAAGGADREFTSELDRLRDGLGQVFGSGLERRIIHGDAKPDNVIIGSIPTIIDLDTVMYGYAALDYGDLIRSVCGGGVPNLSLIRSVTKGFAEGTGGLLTDEEVGSLYYGILWITGELAVRYMTDSLRRNKYFKGKSSEDCLSRAHELMEQLKAFNALGGEINKIIRSELLC
jgi:hypothetical protein